MDRTSLAFAAPEMLSQLGFSTGTYGLGAAAFFLGYTLLQVGARIHPGLQNSKDLKRGENFERKVKTHERRVEGAWGGG